MDKEGALNRRQLAVLGIDDKLNVFGGGEGGAHDAVSNMPLEEKLALADRMIALWQRYKYTALKAVPRVISPRKAPQTIKIKR